MSSICAVFTGIVFFYSLLHGRDRAWGGYVKQGCVFGPVSTSVRNTADVIHVAFYCPLTVHTVLSSELGRMIRTWSELQQRYRSLELSR